jgi:hypothetical protein
MGAASHPPTQGTAACRGGSHLEHITSHTSCPPKAQAHIGEDRAGGAHCKEVMHRKEQLAHVAQCSNPKSRHPRVSTHTCVHACSQPSTHFHPGQVPLQEGAGRCIWGVGVKAPAASPLERAAPDQGQCVKPPQAPHNTPCLRKAVPMLEAWRSQRTTAVLLPHWLLPPTWKHWCRRKGGASARPAASVLR